MKVFDFLDRDRHQYEINPTEVKALLKYAAENKILVPEHDLIVLQTHIVESDTQREHTLQEQVLNFGEVHRAYANLCSLTYPVSGQTVVDSNATKLSVAAIIVFTVLFFGLAITNEIMALYFGDIDVPEESELADIVWFQEYVLNTLSPLFWGAIGSCIYLLKRISDFKKAKTFSRDKLQGWGTRITLGAVLGGVIQYVFDTDVISSSGIDDNALALLVGLSVKVVYGAVEKTVDTLVEKFNLDAVRSGKPKQKNIAEAIASFVTQPSLSDEERKTVLSVLEIYDKHKPDKL
ncbi:hypothetical protein OE749_05640 [Aestuariibacter sp. AA17]|uniref:Uncharacterized protein n=1 Tax=Fluctibacter corallii TaxID=2984329 RepID=A0ABT3A6I3_9ALTE|nr:hypothetical protein [Aestuariibacter sp. AA17]MCV2884169.1 hypothetical protein [Aestuariibacter sp. AA17]